LKNSDSFTPLHCAVWKGHLKIVRLLCDRGADIEARDKDGFMPLHDAAYHGNISIVKELIEVRNADINARSNDEETVLTVARNRGHTDVAAYLVYHGGVE
jgi:ankyrin repeat protein